MQETPHNRHIRIFNSIAPVYRLFFGYQVRFYRSIFQEHGHTVFSRDISSVLDIGCGTGAFLNHLSHEGYTVTGVDAAEKMIQKARKLSPHIAPHFSTHDFIKGLPFKDKSFDMVTACYVAHGLMPEERLKLYEETKRLATKTVFFHDFNPNRHWMIELVEYLEGGDYHGFIQHAPDEMRDRFSTVNIVDVAETVSWYICTP